MTRTCLAVFALGCVVVLAGLAEAQPPGRRGGRPPQAMANSLQTEPLGADVEETKILAAIQKRKEGPRFANVSSLDGRLMRMLAEHSDAKRVVEIGTSTGESAAWLALALRKTGGHLYTHELDEGRAKVAQANFEKAGLDEVITMIMGDAKFETMFLLMQGAGVGVTMKKR